MFRILSLLLACQFLISPLAWCDDQTWEDAVQSLKSNQLKEASEKFGSWIKSKAEGGTYSSEAHYNMFLVQSGLESGGAAAAHLLRSIQLERNPFKNLDTIHTLCELQSRYGIKDGPCQTKYFTLSLLVGNNFLTVFLCLFLWSLVFACLFYFKKKTVLFKSVLLAAILIGGGNLLFFLISKSDYKLMVLSGVDKNIGVYKTEAGKEEEKLVELAQGTLVETSKEPKNGYRQITQPIAGWVSEEFLIVVDESLSKNP